MARQNREATIGKVFCNQFRQHLYSGVIHGHEGLIQYPQWRLTQRQSAQGHAPFLTLRQMTNEVFSPAGNSKPGKNVANGALIGRKTTQCGGERQVLAHRHGLLQAVEVPQVTQITLKVGPLLLDRHVVPQDGAGFDGRQAAQHAQETGFANTIDPHHMQPAPSLKGAVDVLEQLAAAFAAPQRVKAQCR